MDRGMQGYLLNSVTASVGSTALTLVLAIPGAYALSISSVDKKFWSDASTTSKQIIDEAGRLSAAFKQADAQFGEAPAKVTKLIEVA